MNDMDFILSNLDASDKVEERKQIRAKLVQKTETIEESWNRIFSMKNSETDEKKLKEVQKAMKKGKISRSDEDLHKKFSKAEAMKLYGQLQQLDKEDKLSELVKKTPRNYHLILTEDELETLIDEMKNEKIIAVDTETTGIDVYADEIVGLSFTLPKRNRHVYIPVAHDKVKQLKREYVLEKLKPILENPEIGKVLHNAKFDIHMLIRYGIRLKGLKQDTMVAMHVLNENEPSFALKNLVTKYLDEPSDTFEALFGKNFKFNELTDLSIALAYAAKDTDVCYRLYKFQRDSFDRLPQLKTVYDEIENPLIDVVVDMEQTGFTLDMEMSNKLGIELKEQIKEVESKLHESFGEINLNSPTQLKPAIEKLVKRKIESTDVETLKKLKDEHIAIENLLKYRELTKLLGTYVEALPEIVKFDGKIHASFNQMGARTGRFSSQNPNLQNQPKYARKLFIAPSGHLILSGDFSQQEPRLLAHFSGEEILINAYREGKDLYSTAASALWNLPIEECGDGSKYRKMMKTGILAVMYGTGTKTLAKQLSITEEEAQKFINDFYKTYVKVKEWIDGNLTKVRRNGYVEMLFGRKRRLPEIKSSDRGERLYAERQTTNAIIQGSGSIQTKKTLIALHELCERKGWKVLFTIHDEVGIIVPESITYEEVKEFESVMLNTVQLVVPNKTDIEISKRWGEGVSVKEWFHVQ